jgi:hypothetical protein
MPFVRRSHRGRRDATREDGSTSSTDLQEVLDKGHHRRGDRENATRDAEDPAPRDRKGTDDMTKKKLKKKLEKLILALEESAQGQRDALAMFEAYRKISNDRQKAAVEALARVSKFEAFFGPLIAGKNPPLDGAQVASKAYVDDALARLARVLRSEREGAGATPGSLS